MISPSWRGAPGSFGSPTWENSSAGGRQPSSPREGSAGWWGCSKTNTAAPQRASGPTSSQKLVVLGSETPEGREAMLNLEKMQEKGLAPQLREDE